MKLLAAIFIPRWRLERASPAPANEALALPVMSEGAGS
jgi:hypothetical protein